MCKVGRYKVWCSAIRFFDFETKMIMEMFGTRHHEILARIKAAGYTPSYKQWGEQGFLVSTNMDAPPFFISRDALTSEARDYNIPMIGSVITSEDLW